MGLPRKGRFVKKPNPVEAIQWYPGEEIEGVTEIRHSTFGILGEVATLEGKLTIIPGSYIIKDSNGEVSTCKEDIFNSIYEVYDDNKK